jgi:asparagine synthase (glutamine-hydrolysing)
MHSPDGRLTLVFNGEIYNFNDVRTELLVRGHSFRGTGDTEVILAAFREWGADAVERFTGMFALALWDREEQSLLLVRDRVGVKPLYYGWDGRTLCFGSELKALRAFTHWTPELDMVSVGEYLQYGYIAAPRTIYHGVRKLEPGCRLRFVRGREPRVERYWSVANKAGTPVTGDDAAIEAELEELLVDAFKLRMVSDVPVGVYLSGGIDSSLVTALLAKNTNARLSTFTIGFESGQHNEAGFAADVAQHVGTNHTEYILGVGEALQIARGWGKLFDEPFGDPSGIPTLLVSRLAREQVKVVLSADGGDELFAGYSVYDDALARMEQLARLPDAPLSAVSAALTAVPADRVHTLLGGLGVSARIRGLITRRIKRSRAILANRSPAGIYDAAISYWLPEEVDALLGGYHNPRNLLDAYAGEPLEQMCLWDFDHYLPEDVLTKVDRTTMAVSLEGREPMLDHRVAEFAFRLPVRLRHGPLGPKHILKSILYRHVPRELVDRPKQGFTIPLESWLRGDLGDLVRDHLSDDRVRHAGMFDPARVRELVNDFYAGDGRLSVMLWYLLAFEMWRGEWMDGNR